MLTRQGFCLILSSPSGAGKTTLAHRILTSDLDFQLSVSATTREKRPTEEAGKDYHFLSKDEFFTKRDEGAFFEWAEVFDNYYGTLVSTVRNALEEGQDLVFDIDWQGAKQMRKALPHHTVTIFILPPSWDELKRRIYGRGEDLSEVIEKRLNAAVDEISHWQDYDYVLINKDIEESLGLLKTIINAERLKRHRNNDLNPFVSDLLDDASTSLSRHGKH